MKFVALLLPDFSSSLSLYTSLWYDFVEVASPEPLMIILSSSFDRIAGRDAESSSASVCRTIASRIDSS